MPNQDSPAPNYDTDRRTAIRFAVADNSTARCVVAGSIVDARLTDIGLGGCSVSSNGELSASIDDPVAIQFEIDGPDSEVQGSIAYINVDKKTIGVRFSSPVTPWSIGMIAPELAAILKNPDSRARQFRNQRTLAIADIEMLQTAVLGLKDKQFTMLLSGFPIFSALLGASYAYFQSGTANWWVIVLPFLSAVLSMAMLAIFLQKNASIRRQDAFSQLLQTHMSFGYFPLCYRGWLDAYSNYNHLYRYGSSSKYDISTVPSYHKDFKTVPSDAFSLLSIGLLVTLPLISVAMMFAIYLKFKPDPVSHTLLVFGTAIAVGAMYFWFHKEFKSTREGEKSYRSLLLKFDRILHGAPPFNPTSSEPLT